MATYRVRVNVHPKDDCYLVKVWSGEHHITVAEFQHGRDAAIHAAQLADRNDWAPEHKRPLNDIMEFEHVIEVLEGGLIIDRPDIYAPDLFNGKLDTQEPWSLMDGYTGQQGGGDILHDSEFIGGGLERDIRAQPGIYVALVCYWDPEDEDEDEDEDGENIIEGWAVAYRETA